MLKIIDKTRIQEILQLGKTLAHLFLPKYAILLIILIAYWQVWGGGVRNFLLSLSSFLYQTVKE